jgi:hypothetical protein
VIEDDSLENIFMELLKESWFILNS